MPASSRPAGAISPGDMLWKHELRQQNASLLDRMTAIETMFKDQEMRVLRAEEAAAACTSVSEDFNIVKDGVDQLEKRQNDFMNAVHKRLVEMDKDMGEFRKTQERVNKLIESYRNLDDSVANMVVYGPRIEEVEREVQGLKNTIARKHVHEMENMDSRLGALELEQLREYAKIRTIQDGFTQKWNGELQALRTQVARLVVTGTSTQIQQPYMQVPRSPEPVSRSADLLENSISTTNAAKPNDASNNVSRIENHRKAPKRRSNRSRKDVQVIHQDAETTGTTQLGEVHDVEEPNSATIIHVDISPHDHRAIGSSPRKKPKLAHPNFGSEFRRQGNPQTELIHKSAQKPPEHDHMKQSHMNSSKAPTTRLNRKVRLPPDPNHNKIASSVTVENVPKGQQTMATASKRQINPGRTTAPSAQTRQPKPSQPTRRSRRRSGQATFYELGWDCTQQPQKKTGPVYDAPRKPLKTKPRRLPPVPDE